MGSNGPWLSPDMRVRRSARPSRSLGIALAALAIGLSFGFPDAPGLAAVSRPAGVDCDRLCLENTVRAYMAALAAKDPSKAPFAEDVRYSENGVVLPIGDGIWGTASGVRPDRDLIFVDAEAGAAGIFTVVEENGQLGYFGMRLKVRRGKIVEAETMVNRLTFPSGDPAVFKHEPGMLEAIPPAQRTSRERMIDLANGYFSTLQQNDGTLLTRFDPDCSRQENGLMAAGGKVPLEANGNPLLAWIGKVTTLDCGAQFALGVWRMNTRVRDRDFMVVDEERGLILTRLFIDHANTRHAYKTTDGVDRIWPQKTPHTWAVLELFKIKAGTIYRIEATFIEVPYYTATVWPQDRDARGGRR